MNQADEELRCTISQIWPLQANKMLDLLVPPIDQLNRNNLTVGKIYGGLLILETWRNTKFYELKMQKEVTNDFHSIVAICSGLKIEERNLCQKRKLKI